MEEIHIHKKNEVYLKVECDRGIAMELSGYFEFEVPGASFMPSVRNKMWELKFLPRPASDEAIPKGQTLILYSPFA